MPQITDEQVRHVAKLSRLKLDEKQVHYFAGQLSNILGYIETLNELDVSKVEPMAHPTDMVNKFRDDTPRSGLPIEQVLANSPEAEAPFFKVPKVLGEGSGA